MHEDRQLSTEAVNLISEYVDNFPRKENTNLEPDNAHDIDDDADNDDNGDDDSNNDDDDDNDDDYYMLRTTMMMMVLVMFTVEIRSVL